MNFLWTLVGINEVKKVVGRDYQVVRVVKRDVQKYLRYEMGGDLVVTRSRPRVILGLERRKSERLDKTFGDTFTNDFTSMLIE